jgi:hypothetical protein
MKHRPRAGSTEQIDAPQPVKGQASAAGLQKASPYPIAATNPAATLQKHLRSARYQAAARADQPRASARQAGTPSEQDPWWKVKRPQPGPMTHLQPERNDSIGSALASDPIHRQHDCPRSHRSDIQRLKPIRPRRSYRPARFRTKAAAQSAAQALQTLPRQAWSRPTSSKAPRLGCGPETSE